MSGYLLVKSANKAAGFPTFKSWRKQWCTLRPRHAARSVSIVFDASSSSGGSSGRVEIPDKSAARRLGVRSSAGGSKKFTFGVFDSTSKALVFLAAQSESEAQLWMFRIRAMLQGKNASEINRLSPDCYNVSLIDNDFSNLCGFRGLFGILTVMSGGFVIADGYYKNRNIYFSNEYIANIELFQENTNSVDNQRIVIIKTNKNFEFGEGVISIFCLNGKELHSQLKISADKLENMSKKLCKRLSKSEEAIFKFSLDSKGHSKWYCDLAEKTKPELTVTTLKLCNEKRMSKNQNLPTANGGCPSTASKSIESCEDIYCEINEDFEENIYEDISDYLPGIENTPPPLPARYRKNGRKSSSNECDEMRKPTKSSVENEPKSTNLLHSAFGAFRNRIKSESQLPRSTNYEKQHSGNRASNLCRAPRVTSKSFTSPVLNRIKRTEGKSVIPEASNRIEFRSSSDIKRNSRSEAALDRIEYKSYGFDFDEETFERSLSKSEETLDAKAPPAYIYYGFHFPEKEYKFDDISNGWQFNDSGDEAIEDLSLLSPDNSFTRGYPKEVVDLILRGRLRRAEDEIKRLNGAEEEDEYVLMSPAAEANPKMAKANVASESLYLVMS